MENQATVVRDKPFQDLGNQEGRPVTTRQRLMKRLGDAWRELQESYAALPEEQLLESGVTAAWSVRDLIVHVTIWEEEALKHLPLILEGGRPPRYSVTYGGINAFNALTTGQKKNLSLREVLRQRDEVHQRLIEFLNGAPDGQLTAETRFRRRLRLDTYGHYPKHARAIRQWRQRRLDRR
jgi:DinB superfamily